MVSLEAFEQAVNLLKVKPSNSSGKLKLENCKAGLVNIILFLSALPLPTSLFGDQPLRCRVLKLMICFFVIDQLQDKRHSSIIILFKLYLP